MHKANQIDQRTCIIENYGHGNLPSVMNVLVLYWIRLIIIGKHSCLNEAHSLALIKHTELNEWNVDIMQLSIGEYLFLQAHSYNTFGALKYKNKLFVLQCFDSLDIQQTQHYFSRLPDSIKILSDYQSFISECNDYSFIVDTSLS